MKLTRWGPFFLVLGIPNITLPHGFNSFILLLMPSDLVPSSYPKLVLDLAAILHRGREEALNAVNSIRLKTYWEMGRRLEMAKELKDPKAASSLMTQLANDLRMDLPLLYRIRQFYQYWPKRVPTLKNARSTLSWSHFVALLSVKNEIERTFYLEKASKEAWSRDQLRRAIERDFFRLTRQRKKPKDKKTLDRPNKSLNVYKAIVEKVIDGDTLLVRVDLGFEVWVNQRTRFRGINTAEIIRHGIPIDEIPRRAKQAKTFVEKKLEGVEFVVIKTYKTDLYGRYVVDLFYHPTISQKESIFDEGFFLNQQLLDKKLADIVPA